MVTLKQKVEKWRHLVEFYFRPEHQEYALLMIGWESSGNELSASTRSSARGLFQHLEKYWPDRIARVQAFYARAGVEREISDDIFDPEANIAAAAWLLDQSGRDPKWGGWGQWTPSHTKTPADHDTPQFGDPSIPFPKDGYTGKKPSAPRPAPEDGTTAAAPTPAAPTTLKRGDSGEEVKAVQRILQDLGLFHGSIGGNFKTLTEQAVIAFQRSHVGPSGRKLSTTGRVTKATWWALRNLELSAVAHPDLEYGASGEDVKVLQRLLKEAGTFTGSVRGNFKTLTQAAVVEFQKGHAGPDGTNLEATGAVGPDTWWALRNQDASKFAAQSDRPKLERGTRGEAVLELNQLLEKAGALKPPITDRFAKRSEDALLYFQETNLGPDGQALKADGVVGPKTWWALEHRGEHQDSGLSWHIPAGLTKVRLGQLRIAVGEREAGIKEVPLGSNGGPVLKYGGRGPTGGKDGDPWCCYFWSWNNKECFGEYSLGKKLGRCSDVWDVGGQRGMARPNNGTYVPIPGDAFVMKRSRGGHIGFVLRVEVANGVAMSIDTVEGNCGDRVKIAHRSLGDAEIIGFVNNFPDDEQPTDWQRGLDKTEGAAGSQTR